MARLTVSIDEELKARLNEYAEEHHLSASKVVSQALRAYLPGEENPPDPDLVNTQHYVAQLREQLEDLRESVHRMALAQYGPFAPLPDGVTEPLIEPPWSAVRESEDEGEEDESDDELFDEE